MTTATQSTPNSIAQACLVEALGYLTECALATLEGSCMRTASSARQLKRELAAAQAGVQACVAYPAVRKGSPRMVEVLDSGGSVADWACRDALPKVAAKIKALGPALPSTESQATELDQVVLGLLADALQTVESLAQKKALNAMEFGRQQAIVQKALRMLSQSQDSNALALSVTPAALLQRGLNVPAWAHDLRMAAVAST